MYFSIVEARNSIADKLANLPDSALTAQLLEPDFQQVTLESTCVALAKQTKVPLTAVPVGLFKESMSIRKTALTMGAKNLISEFSGEDKVKAFFSQNDSLLHRLRFEGVGGVREDLMTVKNRAALLTGLIDLAPETQEGEQSKPQRAYVDFIKSIRYVLGQAVDQHQLDPSVARTVVGEVETAAVAGHSKQTKDVMKKLNIVVSQEMFDEERERLVDQYRQAAKPSAAPDPFA